jgi:hypothetical protein
MNAPRRRGTVLLLAVLAAGAEARAEEADGGGPVWKLTHHTELRQELGVSAGDGDVQKLRSMLTQELEAELRPGVSLELGLRGWYDARYEVDEGYGRLTGDEGRDRAELREAVVRFSRSSTDWVIGRQLVTWGRADGVRLLDAVNPLDLREFILEDYADSKIPLWMVNRQQYFGDWGWQLLVIGEQRGNRLAPAGTDYYDRFHDPARADGLAGEAPDDFSLDGVELGSQLSGSLGRTDVSLNYLYAYDDVFSVELVPHLSPAGLAIEPRRAFDRIHLAGGSFARPLGSWVLRGELAWIDGRRFAVAPQALPAALLRAPGERGLAERSNFLGLLGADVSGNWSFLSVQLYTDQVGGGVDPLARDRRESIATLFAWRDWRNGALRLQLLSFYHLDEQTWLHQPRVTYQLNDVLSVSLGADLVETESPNAFFGQFHATDRLLTTFKYQH